VLRTVSSVLAIATVVFHLGKVSYDIMSNCYRQYHDDTTTRLSESRCRYSRNEIDGFSINKTMEDGE